MRTTLDHPEWLDAMEDACNGLTTYDLAEPGQPRVRRGPGPRISSANEQPARFT
jgi:hypothetical protein